MLVLLEMVGFYLRFQQKQTKKMTEVVLEPQESGRENKAVHTNGGSRNGGVLSGELRPLVL